MRPQDFLTPEEFARLKAACKDDRERAIVLTLAGTGMRVNELCNQVINNIMDLWGYDFSYYYKLNSDCPLHSCKRKSWGFHAPFHIIWIFVMQQ